MTEPAGQRTGRQGGVDGDVPATFRSRALPARVLTLHELGELAGDIVRRRDDWEHLVQYSSTSRHYVSLYRDAFVEAWLICWTPSSDTGWHDHDTSAGAVAVAEGAVTEHGLALGGPQVVRTAEAGSVLCFGPDHIHRLVGRDPESVTVHVYSPPLWRLGQYTTDDAGVLHRLSVSCTNELRPLEAV